MNKQIYIGASAALVGVVLLIISQTVSFTKIETMEGPFGGAMGFEVPDVAKKNIVLWTGIGLFLGGGICAIYGVKKSAA